MTTDPLLLPAFRDATLSAMVRERDREIERLQFEREKLDRKITRLAKERQVLQSVLSQLAT